MKKKLNKKIPGKNFRGFFLYNIIYIIEKVLHFKGSSGKITMNIYDGKWGIASLGFEPVCVINKSAKARKS